MSCAHEWGHHGTVARCLICDPPSEYERAWEAYERHMKWDEEYLCIASEAFSAGWKAALDAAEAQTKPKEPT